MKSTRCFVASAMALSLLCLVGTGCNRADQKAPESEVDLSKTSDLFNKPMQAPPPADPDQVIATINGKEITRGKVIQEVDRLMSVASRRFPPERLAQMREQFSQQALDNLLLQTLLIDAAEAENIQATAEDIQKERDRIQSSLPAGTTIEELLARSQSSEEEFQRELTMKIRAEKLLEAKTAAITEPAEEELKAFYEQNKSGFAMPESVRASHILLAFQEGDTDEQKAAKKQKAEDLRKMLAEGADFAALAAENSDCPSKSQGGDLGSFPRGQMVKPFEDAAFSQAVGEVGPVVETQFGYHIIKVTSHDQPKSLEFDEVKQNMAARMLREKRQKAAREYIDELRAKADIQFPGAPVPPTAPIAAPAEAPAPAPEAAPAAEPEATPEAESAPVAEPTPAD